MKCFRYLCLRIDTETKITDQKHYTDDLIKITIDASRKTNPSLSITASEKEILRSKIGQLLWICNQTLPTVSIDGSNVASNLKRATIKELLKCNKIIAKSKITALNEKKTVR